MGEFHLPSLIAGIVSGAGGISAIILALYWWEEERDRPDEHEDAYNHTGEHHDH